MMMQRFKDKTALELLTLGQEYLLAHHENTHDAYLLLHDLLGDSVYTMFETPIKDAFVEAYVLGLQRIVAGEPVQYVIGKEMFFGREFRVTPDVLIPRPETEELVLSVLEYIDETYGESIKDLRIADVGTGSGAIAIALAAELKGAKIMASDISADALAIASENAKINEVEISFFEGDMLAPFYEVREKIDILVSNPPYIDVQTKAIDEKVKNNEPHIALFGANEGLYFYEEILKLSKDVLSDRGVIFFEYGYDQTSKIKRLIRQYFPESAVTFKRDMNGKDRICIIQNIKKIRK